MNIKKNIKTKKGMSLMEMIVAIAIFAIGMTGFTMLFVHTWKINSFIIEEGQASFSASRAVTGVVNEIRKARQSDTADYAIYSGDDFDFVVYSDIDNDDITEQVHYFLDGTDFKKGVSKPAGTPLAYPDGDDEESVITSYVMNSGSQPIFYYYNIDYPGDQVNNPMDTPVNVAEVRLVKIHLMVNIKPQTAPENINIESFVELRNLNSYE
jgi:prepilin-type N-terminal cleavage/methylation domain-containing protein